MGTRLANIGASRLPAGVRESVQQMTRQAITEGPYFGSLGNLGLRILGRKASPNAALA